MKIQDCIEDILVRGLDDWIQAAEVASVSRATGGAQSDEASRDLSLKLIRKLLEDGLAEPGMVDEQAGFLPWRVPVDAAMQKIEGGWVTKPAGPELGEICWLNLTESGRAEAQRLWSKKAGRDG
jgi:hypothetical protein